MLYQVVYCEIKLFPSHVGMFCLVCGLLCSARAIESCHVPANDIGH